MKLSIATAVVAATLFTSSDAKKPKKRKTSKRDLVGDCSALSGMTFSAHTSYELNDNIIYSYPCSGSYLRNFASNENLLTDVRKAINDAGKEKGIKADCANLCDIDNGSYDTTSSTGYGDLFDALDNPEVFCNINHGILNDPTIVRNDDFGIGPNGENACECLPGTRDGYKAGCAVCEGVVEFKVNNCVDASNAGKRTKKTKKPKSSSSSEDDDTAPAPAPSDDDTPPAPVEDDDTPPPPVTDDPVPAPVTDAPVTTPGGNRPPSAADDD